MSHAESVILPLQEKKVILDAFIQLRQTAYDERGNNIGRYRSLGVLRKYDLERLQLAYRSCSLYFKTGRIYPLNDSSKSSVAKELGYEGDSKKVFETAIQKYRGFFIPHIGKIFYREDLSEADKKNTLIHECIHTYQYHYRLPTDLETLQALGVPEDQKINILSFYYEMEAHWLTQKIEIPEPWLKLTQSTAASSVKINLLGVLDVFTFGISTVAGGVVFNQGVPSVDKVPLGRVLTSTGGLENYWFSMPVSCNCFDIPGGVSGLHRYSFHRNFLTSLQQTQFIGRTPFLFDKNGKDRAIFNALTEQFYNKLDTVKSVSASPDVENIFVDTILKNQGPLVVWSDPKVSKALKGDVSSTLSSEDRLQLNKNYQADYMNRLLKSKNQSDPKLILDGRFKNQSFGGEGSTPDMELKIQNFIQNNGLSYIELQPQIEFFPLEDKSELSDLKQGERIIDEQQK